MPRLDTLDPEQLNDAQREVYDAIQSGPRGKMPLVGPFAVWVRSPTIGNAVQTLGGVARFGTDLTEDVKEVAICTVGAHYHAKFEFAAHARLARNAGVDSEAVDALQAGAAPSFPNDEQATAHAVAKQLVEQHRIQDETYAKAVDLFGEARLIELVSIIGYYTLVSFTLNAFEVPLGDNMDDPFPDYS